MKTIKFFNTKSKIFINQNILILSILIILFSCNEEEFLKEVPLSFYSTENVYVTYDNFEAATNNLYASFRDLYYGNEGMTGVPFTFPRGTLIGTDMISYCNDYDNFPDALVATNSDIYDYVWHPAYKIIYDANVIIGRSESEIAELTDEQKIKLQAEARFFRGYIYKLLGNVFGGVPIVLKETSEPKRDYVRATREETYQQCVSDLQFAAANLSDINEVADHRISNLAAYHALAEAYLSLQQWDNAISAASIVIDDPNTALMTERFGSRINDVFNPDYPWASGGDPYWDLFRKDNQNRSSGNTEALWVIQFAYNTPGGGTWPSGGYRWETFISPRTWQLKIREGGKTVSLLPLPNDYYGGRGAALEKPSNYFFYTIWQRSGWDEDIRNSDYNIIRDVKVPNPASSYYGKWVFKDSVPIILESYNDTVKNWYPIIAKVVNMGDLPKDLWHENQTVYGSTTTTGGPGNTTYRDEYQIRLAETYLVRAEAYLAKNDLVKAAEDINVIRNRAQAPEVDPSEVDIDYILDERARELAWEENRLQTLTRLGKLVERTNKYIPTWKLYDYQNLWPIPYSEIEKNTEALLEQNPGY